MAHLDLSNAIASPGFFCVYGKFFLRNSSPALLSR